MQIKLQEPFGEYYAGYKVFHKTEGRHMLCLLRYDGTRTTMSWARYLLCVRLGQLLPDGIDADHIDNNKTNDSPDNLQPLPKVCNLEKSRRPATMVELVCPMCAKVFTRPRRQTHLVKGGLPTCCSRRCGGQRSHITAREKVAL